MVVSHLLLIRRKILTVSISCLQLQSNLFALKSDFALITAMAPKTKVAAKQGNVKEHQTSTSNKTATTSSKKKKSQFFSRASSNASLLQPGSKAAKPKGSVARIPSSVSEASSNWKALCSTIKPVQSKKRAEFVANLKKQKESLKTEDNQKKPSSTDDKKEPEVWFDDVDPILLDSKEMASTAETEKIPGIKNEYVFTFKTKSIMLCIRINLFLFYLAGSPRFWLWIVKWLALVAMDQNRLLRAFQSSINRESACTTNMLRLETK